MRITHSAILLATGLFFTAGSARAQEPAQVPAGPAGLTAISMTHSVSVPLEGADDLAARQNDALRAFYDLVAGTCNGLRATIAESCEITMIDFTFRSNERPTASRPDQQNTVRIDGRLQILARLKAEVGPPSPENSRRRPSGAY